jgi:hypothetical protein
MWSFCLYAAELDFGTILKGQTAFAVGLKSMHNFLAQGVEVTDP